jgi:phosphoribosylglycinamide formyltransferase-1
MRTPLQLGFLASHGASGMRAILEAIAAGALEAQGRVLISNNEHAAAHEVAAQFGMPHLVLNAKRCGGEAALDQAICAALVQHGAELVVLSGYMRLLGPQTLARYKRRILNIHPALLPRFGGKGMYGDHVHRAVLAAGERLSGASVHLVDEQYDHGPVLRRREAPVEPGDTVDTLRARVQALEGALYVDTLRAIAGGEIDLDNPPAA